VRYLFVDISLVILNDRYFCLYISFVANSVLSPSIRWDKPCDNRSSTYLMILECFGEKTFQKISDHFYRKSIVFSDFILSASVRMGAVILEDTCCLDEELGKLEGNLRSADLSLLGINEFNLTN